MTWKPEIDELEHRKQLAYLMGGAGDFENATRPRPGPQIQALAGAGHGS